MEKSLTRAEIEDLLQPRSKDRPIDRTQRTLDAIDATVRAIEAGEIEHAYSEKCLATAMGYLLVGCADGATREARQAITPYGLSGVVKFPSTDELRAGSATLRSLLKRKAKIRSKRVSE